MPSRMNSGGLKYCDSFCLISSAQSKIGVEGRMVLDGHCALSTSLGTEQEEL